MTANRPQNTLYIIYNARGTLTGKLVYGYRKLTAPKAAPATATENNNASGSDVKAEAAGPVCAACDITHGGLSLRETSAWVEAKKRIVEESQGTLAVEQVHRDEIPEDLRAFVKSEGIRYPAVVLRRGSAEGSFVLVLDSRELAGCNGDAGALVDKVREKGIFQEQASL